MIEEFDRCLEVAGIGSNGENETSGWPVALLRSHAVDLRGASGTAIDLDSPSVCGVADQAAKVHLRRTPSALSQQTRDGTY
jgi:hypothetical protein